MNHHSNIGALSLLSPEAEPGAANPEPGGPELTPKAQKPKLQNRSPHLKPKKENPKNYILNPETQTPTPPPPPKKKKHTHTQNPQTAPLTVTVLCKNLRGDRGRNRNRTPSIKRCSVLEGGFSRIT